MVHSVRKSLKEHGDKVEQAERDKIEAAIKDLEGVLKSDDKDDIQKKTEVLMQASHKLAEQIYKQTQGGRRRRDGRGGGGS